MARRRRSGTVEVPISEVLDQIDDDDLLDEVNARDLCLGEDDGIRDDVREAYEELRCGRAASALTILDRLVNPKWSSVAACEKEYAKARKGLV